LDARSARAAQHRERFKKHKPAASEIRQGDTPSALGRVFNAAGFLFFGESELPKLTASGYQRSDAVSVISLELPPQLRSLLVAMAVAENLSLSEVVRQTLRRGLDHTDECSSA
jgi:hypothetical protein